MNRKVWKISSLLNLLLTIFWLFAVIFPLLSMFSKMVSIDIFAVISTNKFINALKQSVIVSTVSTLISVAIASIISWLVARTRIKYKTILSTLITMPMLLPSISHGMGLIIILGSNGWLSKMLGIEGGIYGFWGIVIGSVMYSFPVAYLMIYDILKYEDGTQYEAASVLGLNPIDTFLSITLPYMRKPMISVFFAVFTMIITDYGVPLMVGGKYMTLPVMMYQDVIGMLDFGKGSVIGTILLIPALIACILDISNRDKGNSSFVGKPLTIKNNKTRDLVAYVLCLFILILIFLPIGSFSILGFIKSYPIDMSFSLNNISQAIKMGALRYLRNSIVVALVVSVFGTLLALINAYMTSRNKTKYSYVLHLMSIMSLAIPGIVLGLSYIMFFKKSVIYGTFIILFLVNSIHFFSSPYLMAYNTFGKINENLENVGSTIGINKWSIIKDVIIPQSKSTIFEMMSYFFVNCMMTISAVSFLANTSNKPLSLMIVQFEGQMQLECAAFVSILIFFVNIVLKSIVLMLKEKYI